MSRSLRQFALLATVLTAAGAGGCTRSLVQHKQPPDPLLVSKKPVEGKPRGDAPAPRSETAARIDPPPPPTTAAGDATVVAPDPDVRRQPPPSSGLVVRPGR